MTMPTVAVNTTNLDAGTDSRAAARVDLLDAVTKLNQIIDHIKPLGADLLDDTTTSQAQTTLGGTTVGKALFTATDEAAARAAIAAPPQATRTDVASASTINLTTSSPNCDDIRITGTATINNVTIASGRVVRATLAGACTLVNSSNIVTQSGRDIKGVAGATLVFRATAANTVEVLFYTEPAKGDSGLITISGGTSSVSISVPTGRRVYTVAFTTQLSLSASALVVQLVKSGTGVVGTHKSVVHATNGTAVVSENNSALQLTHPDAVGTRSTTGTVELTGLDTPLEIWICSGTAVTNNTIGTDWWHSVAGRVNGLSQEFDAIDFFPTGGATFNSGTVKVSWE